MAYLLVCNCTTENYALTVFVVHAGDFNLPFVLNPSKGRIMFF